jgi:hypothetical protein
MTCHSLKSKTDKTRFFHRIVESFEDKRRLLVGRDLSITRSIDVFSGMKDERIAETMSKTNIPSYLNCHKIFCRDTKNGIAIMCCGFNSGMTYLGAFLVESE